MHGWAARLRLSHPGETVDYLCQVPPQVEREQSMGKRRREGKVKVKVGKVGKGGAGVEEPGRRGEVRLEAKKHRRSSRRSVAQALDGLSGGAVREAEELAADEGAAERWR